MAWRDLREFLDAMEQEGEVLQLDEPVDPYLELGAVWTKLTRQQGPIGLHPKGTVEGYPEWTIVTNIFGTFHRLARSFQVEDDDLFSYVGQQVTEDVAPKVVEDGPVNEHEFLGNEVDLTTQIPNIHWNEQDAGCFITFGHNVMEDSEYGINAATYRIQLLDSDRMAMRLAPRHDGDIFARRAKSKGKSELPVAVYIGGPPTAICGTVASLPIGRDEYDVMGALRGEALELVECKTNDLTIPATAEVVIEGKMLLDEMIEEGPFGEFSGTYSDSYQEHPIKVTRIAHRNDPIFVGTAESAPINETHILQSTYYSAKAKSILSEFHPAVTDVFLPPESGALFECIIQIDSELKRSGLAKNILMSGVMANTGAKTFIVVDDDVDIQRRDEVQTALATRVQADRDVMIISDATTTPLDPSSSYEGVTDKMFIDATRSEDFRGELIRLDPSVSERADEILRIAHKKGD